MKYNQVKLVDSYRPGIDDKCAHCMQPFDDEDELGKCSLTNHYTHSICSEHDG